MNAIVKPRFYVGVFAALLVLTGATVGLSFLNLGEWHTTVGLVIAAAKAVLILLFFMHILHAPRLIWLVAISGLFWLGILMSLTLMDYLSRGWGTY